MIIAVLGKGRDMPGLMRYLFGSGKTDEHSNQHIVAGSNAVVSEWAVTPSADTEWVLPVSLGGSPEVNDAQDTDRGDAQLSTREAAALGRTIEGSWRSQHLEAMAVAGRGPESPRGGISSADRYASPEPEHVYHVTMSLRADEGAYTDQQWQTLAQEYVRGMGFVTDEPTESCEWVAVHHGPSKDGKDHIHLAVNLVRNSGERVNLHYTDPDNPNKVIGDFGQAQMLRRQMEERHSFVRSLTSVGLDSRAAGTTKYSKAEARRAAAREEAGRGNRGPDRIVLQRLVRGAASAATTEAEFVQALHDAGVVATPNWAPGGRDQVRGFSVALRSPMPEGQGSAADRDFKISGSKLASDLSLSKLRQTWAPNETDTTRSDAVVLWRDGPPEHGHRVDATRELQDATAALSRWNDRLEATPAQDVAAWRSASTQITATVSLVASQCGRDPALRPLAPIAHRLNQAMWHDRRDDPGPLPRQASDDAVLAARHLNLALRAGGLSSTGGWFAVMQQLQRTVRAVEDARSAREELHHVTASVQSDLASVSSWVRENEPVTLTQAQRRALTSRGTTRGTGRPARPGQRPSQERPQPHRPGKEPESGRGRDPGLGR